MISMEVMGNLLDNACKYCLEFVEVSARQTDNELHIIVEDDGPGIPRNKRDVVFDRGQRADTLRPGQGVGLAVARRNRRPSTTEKLKPKTVYSEAPEWRSFSVASSPHRTIVNPLCEKCEDLAPRLLCFRYNPSQ